MLFNPPIFGLFRVCDDDDEGVKRVRADAESPSINSITQLVNLVRPFMRNSLTDTDAVCDFICLATSAISLVP